MLVGGLADLDEGDELGVEHAVEPLARLLGRQQRLLREVRLLERRVPHQHAVEPRGLGVVALDEEGVQGLGADVPQHVRRLEKEPVLGATRRASRTGELGHEADLVVLELLEILEQRAAVEAVAARRG